MLGVLAGRLDTEIEKRSKIRPGLHVAGRALAFAGLYFFCTRYGQVPLLAIPMAMGVFGIVFRAAFNIFSLRKMDFVGTTAYYDRFARYLSEKIPMEPAQIQLTIEFLAFFIPLIILLK